MRRFIPVLAVVIVGSLAVGSGAVLTYRALGPDHPGQFDGDALAAWAPTDRAAGDLPESELTAPGARPRLRGRSPIHGSRHEDPPSEDARDETEEVIKEVSIGIGVPFEHVEEPAERHVDTSPFREAWPGEPRSDSAAVRAAPIRRVDLVQTALFWLKAHQSRNGAWEANGYRQVCKGEPVEEPALSYDAGKGNADRDEGVTGLALLAYLGAGYTNRGKHPFKKTVSRGLRHLKNVQDPEGCFGPRHDTRFLFDHAFAAFAMTEAYAMTGSPIFKGSAQRGIDFIAQSQSPRAGWGLRVRDGTSDPVLSGLMMIPIKSALLLNADAVERERQPPLVVGATMLDDALAWMELRTDFGTGRLGYSAYGAGLEPPMGTGFRLDASRTSTALGILARVYAGHDPRKSRVIRNGANEIT